MNAFPLRRLLLFVLSLTCLHLIATAAFAAGSGVDSAATLQANFMFDLVADRARMIQVSVVFVALGCALIWWYR